MMLLNFRILLFFLVYIILFQKNMKRFGFKFEINVFIIVLKMYRGFLNIFNNVFYAIIVNRL